MRRNLSPNPLSESINLALNTPPLAYRMACAMAAAERAQGRR